MTEQQAGGEPVHFAGRGELTRFAAAGEMARFAAAGEMDRFATRLSFGHRVPSRP
ncbi:MAG: hypothetical protein ACKOHG_15095 [Planctomycetia bacterium]